MRDEVVDIRIEVSQAELDSAIRQMRNLREFQC